MKSPKFEYVRPESAHEVAHALAGEVETRVLAGGQSLVPMLSMRLCRPQRVIDLNPARDLAFIKDDNGAVTIGATTRMNTVLRDPAVADRLPLLRQALGLVANSTVRNRGTVVGSLAHASPVAELPAVAVALDAEFFLLSADGERTIRASEFYLAPFVTQRQDSEFIRSVRFPAARVGEGHGFDEASPIKGHFPWVSAASYARLLDGKLAELVVVVSGLAGRPIRVTEVGVQVAGQSANEADVTAIAREVRRLVEPQLDPAAGPMHVLPVKAPPVPSRFLLSLVEPIVRRATSQALSTATNGVQS